MIELLNTQGLRNRAEKRISTATVASVGDIVGKRGTKYQYNGCNFFCTIKIIIAVECSYYTEHTVRDIPAAC